MVQWASQLAMQPSAVCMLGWGGVVEHGHSDTILQCALDAILSILGGGPLHGANVGW